MPSRILVLIGIIITGVGSITLPSTTVPAQLQDQKFFLKAMEPYDDTVYSWITGQKFHVIKRIIMDVFRHNTYQKDYALSLFQVHGDTDSLLKNDDKMADFQDTNFKDTLQLPYCAESPKCGDGEYNNVLVWDDEELNHKQFLDVNDVPTGCFYFYGDIANKKYLVCDSNELHTIPTLPPVLDVFEMNTTMIKCIRPGAFKNVEIGIVRLNSNQLTTVCPSTFAGIKENTMLQLAFNQISNLWLESAFAGLDNTSIFNLEHNKITYEGVGEICREREPSEIEPVLPKLVHLTLKGNPLKIIPRTMFTALRESPLNYVILENCQLQWIHPEAFKYLPNLKQLDISENPHLMSNLSTAFQGIQPGSLTHLNLARNSLSAIPTEAFEMVSSSLREVDLRGNGLHTLTANSFPVNMSEMKQINFEECMLSSIEDLTFANMPNLETLSFKGNRLRTVPAAISNLVQLNILDFSFQNEENPHVPFEFEIPLGSFTNLVNMKFLILSHTPIGYLKEKNFAGMIKLNMLLLENCGIKSIEDKTFDDLKGLRVLRLANNPLKVIRAEMFYGLGLLTTLYLSDCEFSFPDRMPGNSLEQEYIQPVEPVDPIYDFVTMGQVINQAIIEEAGEEFDLSYRPFYYLNRLEYFDLTGNNIRDLYPETFVNLYKLYQLNLSSNQISGWDTPMFRNNTDLEQLYLDGNQILTVTDAMLEDYKQIGTGFTASIDLTVNPFVCGYGICRLKDETEGGRFDLMNWDQNELYTCIMTDKPKSFSMNISNLTREFCDAQHPPGEEPTTETTTTLPTTLPTTIETTTPSEPPTTTPGDIINEPTIPTDLTTPKQETTTVESDPPPPIAETSENHIVTYIAVSFVVVLVVGLAFLGYRKRQHLRYFCFVARLKFKIPLRKARTSELIEKDSYDFDVFISYSHYDSEFIQDRLVPELEGTGKYIDKSMEEDAKSVDSGFTNPIFIESGSEKDSNSSIVDMDSISLSSGSSGSSTASNLKVCLHERDFEVGTPITENIIECVDRSRKIIVVVSKKYLESQWCLFEMNLAYHRLVEARRRSFVVILLEEIPAGCRTKVLNYLMRSRTYLEWPRGSPDSPSVRHEQKVFFKRLKRSLAAEDRLV